jgi:stringent starvation protein B
MGSMSEESGGGSEPGEVVQVNFGKGRKGGGDLPEQLPHAEDAETRSVEKLKAFETLIDQGMTMVILDARRMGTNVPRRFSNDPQLRLNFSHRFFLEDFVFDDTGVRATLSFSGEPLYCDVPWTSVFAMTGHSSGEGMLWPEDVPRELQMLISMPARPPRDRSSESSGPRPVPSPPPEMLAAAAEEEDVGEESGNGDGEKKPPFLQLVKNDDMPDGEGEA